MLKAFTSGMPSLIWGSFSYFLRKTNKTIPLPELNRLLPRMCFSLPVLDFIPNLLTKKSYGSLLSQSNPDTSTRYTILLPLGHVYLKILNILNVMEQFLRVCQIFFKYTFKRVINDINPLLKCPENWNCLGLIESRWASVACGATQMGQQEGSSIGREDEGMEGQW